MKIQCKKSANSFRWCSSPKTVREMLSVKAILRFAGLALSSNLCSQTRLEVGVSPAPRRKKSGFTLIEVLVVVAIIGLLAALLFPVFARARENARRASCLSNMKQIGLGLLQYVGDYDEQNSRIWYGSSGDSNATTSYKWMDAIYPYVKSEQIFTCPSHTLPVTIGTSTFDAYKFRTGRNWGSYAANSSYFGVTLGGASISPFNNPSVAAWEAPATTIYAADGMGRYNISWAGDGSDGLLANPSIVQGSPRYFPSVFQLVERHLQTTPVLYCDGHAKKCGGVWAIAPSCARRCQF